MINSRPLNIHPNIWNLRQKKKQQQKKIDLDEYTKLNNSIDMFVQALQLFKKTYNDMNLQQYTQQEMKGLIEINDLVDSALIPYTIDIVKKFNSINMQDVKK